ncbi:MAG: hypothetical protein QW551_00830 [Desulfurococcaceae archaeon]
MNSGFKRVLINKLSSIYMLPLYASLSLLGLMMAFSMEAYKAMATSILITISIYYVLRIYIYFKLGIFQRTMKLPRLLIRYRGFNRGFSVFLLISSIISLVEPYIARVTNIVIAWFASTMLVIVIIYVIKRRGHWVKSYIFSLIALILLITQYLLGMINEYGIKNIDNLVKLLEEVLHGG